MYEQSTPVGRQGPTKPKTLTQKVRSYAAVAAAKPLSKSAKRRARRREAKDGRPNTAVCNPWPGGVCPQGQAYVEAVIKMGKTPASYAVCLTHHRIGRRLRRGIPEPVKSLDGSINLGAGAETLLSKYNGWTRPQLKDHAARQYPGITPHWKLGLYDLVMRSTTGQREIETVNDANKRSLFGDFAGTPLDSIRKLSDANVVRSQIAPFTKRRQRLPRPVVKGPVGSLSQQASDMSGTPLSQPQWNILPVRDASKGQRFKVGLDRPASAAPTLQKQCGQHPTHALRTTH